MAYRRSWSFPSSHAASIGSPKGLMRKAKKQPMEFSKIILIVAGVMNAVVIIFTIIVAVITTFLIPYLKAKVDAEKKAYVMRYLYFS